MWKQWIEKQGPILHVNHTTHLIFTTVWSWDYISTVEALMLMWSLLGKEKLITLTDWKQILVISILQSTVLKYLTKLAYPWNLIIIIISWLTTMIKWSSPHWVTGKCIKFIFKQNLLHHFQKFCLLKSFFAKVVFCHLGF